MKKTKQNLSEPSHHDHKTPAGVRYTNMSFDPNDPIDPLSEGVQQLGLEDPSQNQLPLHQKKKRPARAYHNLQQPKVKPAHSHESALHGYDPFNQGSRVASGSSSPSPFPQQLPNNVGASLQSAFSTPQAPFQSQFQQPTQFQQQYSQQFPQQSPMGMESQYSNPAARRSSTINLSNPSQAASDDLSVPHHRHISQEEWQFQTFKSFQNSLPPTATTKYSAYDQGCSIPKFATLSMYQIPETEALRNSTKLPLGLSVHPFAKVGPNEEPVPQVTMDPFDGPLRCRRCRTYINPMMKFTHDQKFICNMCKFASEVPQDYIAPLDASGRRVDYLQKPELCKGTIDFIVPEKYWLEEGQKPSTLHQIFLIDVSAATEILEATVDAIRDVIETLNNGTKVAIIAYDDRIHFFELESDFVNVHTLSDLEDPFIPIQKGLFVDPQENSMQINAALARVVDLYNSFKSASLAYGSALKTSLLALKQYGGGKISATLSKIPSWSVGSLVNTNDRSNGSNDFKTSNEFYLKLSDEFVSSNVGLDLFVISKSSVDLINSASPVFATGGLLKLYSNFNPERDYLQFSQDFYQSIHNTTGYQGQLKVRSSNGLQIQSYYGNFLNPSKQDPKLPVLNSDQEITVLFSYDAKLNPKEDAHFQTALLYTGVDGLRRVRVINSIAAITHDVASVFAFSDQDAILNIIIKNCLRFISKQNPTEIKLSTTTKLTEIFTQYRALVANSHSRQAQLILPDSLTTLTAYISSFQKSKVFRASTPNNLKIYDYYQLNSLPLDKLLLHLYPRIISLHDLKENEGIIDRSTGLLNYPENKRASVQFIQEGGAYLLFDGEHLYVWIHHRVNPLLLKDLFEVPSLEQLNPNITQFPRLETRISQQAVNIVEYYQQLLGRDLLPFQILRQGLDGVEFQFGDYLVEDRAIDKTESYMELISLVHKNIKENLDQEKVVKISEVSHDDSTIGQRFVHF